MLLTLIFQSFHTVDFVVKKSYDFSKILLDSTKLVVMI